MKNLLVLATALFSYSTFANNVDCFRRIETDSFMKGVISKVNQQVGDSSVTELRIESYDISQCTKNKDTVGKISYLNKSIADWEDDEPSVSAQYKFIGSIEKNGWFDMYDEPNFNFDRDIYFHLKNLHGSYLMDWFAHAYTYSDGFSNGESGSVIYSKSKNIAHKIYVFIEP